MSSGIYMRADGARRCRRRLCRNGLKSESSHEETTFHTSTTVGVCYLFERVYQVHFRHGVYPFERIRRSLDGNDLGEGGRVEGVGDGMLGA